MIWGVDTGCIIDRITDLFLYSKRDIMVTIHKQTNTRADRLFNTFTFSLPFYVSVSILLESIQMAKRSSRAARDQEEDDQSHARRRRRDNADDEVAASSTRNDSDQRQATRRSSRHRGAEVNADRRGEDLPLPQASRDASPQPVRSSRHRGAEISADRRGENPPPPQASRDASIPPVRSPEDPRRHRSETRIASVRPRTSNSRDHIAVEEAPRDEDPMMRDLNEQREDDREWKNFIRHRRNDEHAFRTGRSRKPNNWIDDDWDAWNNAYPRRAERMRQLRHPASRPAPPPLSTVTLPNQSSTVRASPLPTGSLGADNQMEDVSDEEDDVEVLSIINSPGADSAPPPNKVKASQDKIAADIKHRDARKAAAQAIVSAAKAFKTPEVKKTARKTTAPSSPRPPTPPRALYGHVGSGRYIPLDPQSSSSPSPPPHTSRRVVAESSNDEGSPNKEGSDPLKDPIYIRRKSQLEELRRSASASETESKGPKAAPSSSKELASNANKKKRSGLRMHPLSGAALRAGGLGPDASLASVLTFGLLGIHSSAADFVVKDEAVRGTIVWEFGAGDDRQFVFRDLTSEERRSIPIMPSREDPEKKDENAEESDEEESDD